jgi:hypothetical protein
MLSYTIVFAFQLASSQSSSDDEPPARRPRLDCVTISSDDEDIKPIILPDPVRRRAAPHSIALRPGHTAHGTTHVWTNDNDALKYFRQYGVYMCQSCRVIERTAEAFLANHRNADAIKCNKKELYIQRKQISSNKCESIYLYFLSFLQLRINDSQHSISMCTRHEHVHEHQCQHHVHEHRADIETLEHSVIRWAPA